MALLDVIYEDRDLLVVNKPAGLVCHPTKGDQYSSLISRARLHAGAGVNCRLVNRLDRETSGLTVVAKNDAAARELGRVWEDRRIEKVYLAVVGGWVVPERGRIEAPLGKDSSSKVAIKDCVRPDGAPALTEFSVLHRLEREVGQPARNERFSVVRVEPRTGRKHQIRIHLAHLGHPVVGDKLYGPDEECYLAFVEGRLTPEQKARLVLENHALMASELRFEWRGRDWHFRAPPPCELGGWLG